MGRSLTAEIPYRGETLLGRNLTKEKLPGEKPYLHDKTYWLSKLFTCEQCSKAFTHANSLKNHVRTHACEKCPKVLSQATHLNEHMSTHTGESSILLLNTKKTVHVKALV